MTICACPPRPSVPDIPALRNGAEARAAELRPHLARPRRGWRAWRRRAAAYRTALANFRLNRRLHRAGREDLRPLYFIWTVLRQCNFRCTYCDDHRGRKYPELSMEGTLDTEQGLRLLEIMRTRTPAVYFAGGEPTMRKDLPTLTRAARDLDYYPIVINTNGSLVDRRLADPAWRTWLADTDIVVVSLDGLDMEAMGRLWVTRRPEDVLRGLLLLHELSREMRFKLMVNCVIRPGHAEQARAVLDLAADLGICFCPVPVNVGPEMDKALREDAEYEALVALILRRKREGQRISGSMRMNRRLLRSAPLRCRNTLKPHVDHDGRLAWPCKASVHVAPEWIDVLGFDDVDALYEHARQRLDPTGFHGPGPTQCGGSCAWAQNYTTDAYAHGLRHPTSLLREVAQFLSRG